MRIALISTLSSPVREINSGSVESIVWLLAREYAALGHDVTVFGANGSSVHGSLVGSIAAHGASDALDDWHVAEWINLTRAVRESHRFDILHSHVYLWGLPLEPLARSPMVHTMHVMPYEDDARQRRLAPQAWVTALSRFHWSQFPDLAPYAIIPSAVDEAQFTFRPAPEDYVCYFGRFTSGKGPARAIAMAKELGLRIKLAGPKNDYFTRTIEPLVDGASVEYAGFLIGRERDRLLGGARALLFPLQEPEPFPLVPVEAMLCGTPVVMMRRGASPEVIDEAVTGYCAADEDEFKQRVLEAVALDRHRVHERARMRFSPRAMAAAYLEVYEAIVERSAPLAREKQTCP
jgi:glycosyltransferase involved in cell wall biosynthesis